MVRYSLGNIALTTHRDDPVDLFLYRILKLVDLADLGLLQVTHAGDLLANRKVEELVHGCALFEGVHAQMMEPNNDDIIRIKKTTGFAIGVGFLTGVLFFFITILKPHFVLSLFTDIEEIKTLGSQYIVVGAPVFLLLGITVPLSTALRATQQSKIPMLISIGGFGANTFLNYCLIFGNLSFPAMGVKGAALATVISRTIEVSLKIGRAHV